MIQHIAGRLSLLWLAVDTFWVLCNMPAAAKGEPFLFIVEQEGF